MSFSRHITQYLQECTRCGNCCNETQKGDVFLFPLDLWRLAENFHKSLAQFAHEYCTEVEYEVPERWRQKNFDGKLFFIPIYVLTIKKGKPCPFYEMKGRGCQIYQNRPDQCRYFPFIECILSDPDQIKPLVGKCRVTDTFLQDITASAPNVERNKQKSVKGFNLRLDGEIIRQITQQEQVSEDQYISFIRNKKGDLTELYHDYLTLYHADHVIKE